jgi:hypothetical protein
MAAGMHDAHFLAEVVRLDGGAERHVGALHHRQRLHVGAQRDCGTRPARFQEADHTGPGNAGLHGQPQFPQVIGYYLCRTHFAVGEFRVLVEVPPPGNDLRINGIERPIKVRGPCNRNQRGHERYPG